MVLKLGVATLLRVVNCQKRVAKFDKKENLTYIAENMAKIRVLTWYFSHLEGCKIPWGSWDFSDMFKGRQPKKFENPWVRRLQSGHFCVGLSRPGVHNSILPEVRQKFFLFKGQNWYVFA